MSATKEITCKHCKGRGTLTVYVDEWAEMWERIRYWFRRVRCPHRHWKPLDDGARRCEDCKVIRPGIDNDRFEPGSPNYVGHTMAKKMGRARCTCPTHGTWRGANGERVDILCPFHGR